MNPLYPAAGVLIAVLALGNVLLWKAAGHEREQKAEIQGRFDAFQTDVKRLGDAQKAKNDQTLKEREKINAASYKALQDRYAALDARYNGLRGNQASSGSGGVSPVPNAPVCPDAAANSDQLLAVLEAADRQTAQLIELQDWVKKQK